MKLYFVFIILLVMMNMSCSPSSNNNGHRPYQSGLTQGAFEPVITVAPGTQAESNKPSETTPVQKRVYTQFKDLKFTLDIDGIEDGKSNSKVRVNFKGKMIINGKTKVLDLKKSYSRFSPSSRKDILEVNEFWAFRLFSKDNKIVSDIMCTKKWDCKVVVMNIYWYEKGQLKRRQFYVKTTLQDNRVEEEVSEVQEEDSHDHEGHEHDEEVAEVEIEDEPTNEEATEFRNTPFRAEDMINNTSVEVSIEEVDVENIENNESVETVEVQELPEDDALPESQPEEELQPEPQVQIISQIEEDIIELRTFVRESSYSLPINQANFELENLIFDYNSEFVAPVYQSDIPDQASGSQGAGKLSNADSIPYVPIEDIEVGTVPLALYRSVKQRHFGTTPTTKLIEAVSESLFAQLNKTMLVGDISRRSGGVLQGHGSHQNGLDIDVRLFTKSNVAYGYNVNSDNFKDFDTATNYQFFKELYSKAKAYDDSNEQSYSYVLAVLMDQQIKDKLCQYAKTHEPAALANEESDTYQMFRRMKHWTGHADHYHIRLSCTTNFCRDHGSILATPECD